MDQSTFRRFRPLRATSAIRDEVRETRLVVTDFVLPLFIEEGQGIEREVKSMPGVFTYSPDRLAAIVEEASSLGIPSVLLFGVPARKDAAGSEAWNDHGIVPQAIQMVRRKAPQLKVMTDVCLCEYTDHGHCGVLVDGPAGPDVDNDSTLPFLQKIALSHARSGAQVVAPSGMMDGAVQRIRQALDQQGFAQVEIMAYAAKFASAFYGPFREAVASAPQFGDRRGYQMDPANGRQALDEIAADESEGAAILMVKPAMSYLDVVSRARARTRLPLAAYNVSGEYAMVKAAGDKGWLDPLRTAAEIVLSMKRAGADIIITYHALELARALKDGRI